MVHFDQLSAAVPLSSNTQPFRARWKRNGEGGSSASRAKKERPDRPV